MFIKTKQKKTKSTANPTDWKQVIQELGPVLAQNSKKHDEQDSFVTDNYALLVELGILSAMIPESIGGQGVSHAEMCDTIRRIAHHCPSTALALSMHQHVVATNIWRHIHQNESVELLASVVENDLILVSTGARDWRQSSGRMKKIKKGYLVNARKHFASQSVAGDLLVSSAVLQDHKHGDQVLHFTIPIDSPGINLHDDWYTQGMRGTGSQTLDLHQVFIPDENIVAIRPRNQFPDLWNVVLTVATPLIMSPYLGIAEKSQEIVLQYCRTKRNLATDDELMAGEMDNFLCSAQLAHQDMITRAKNFDFEPNEETGMAMLTRKTLIAKNCKACVDKAIEILGGKSYFRSSEIEKLFRDVQAVSFHPLPEKEQMRQRGRFLIHHKQTT